MSQWDAIVIGAGAGGGVAAAVLAESGKKVLLLERGKSLSFAEVGRDHLRNQRLPQYDNNVGPDRDGNPRVFEHDGHARVVQPWEGSYHNNAACVGSGTRVYGAQAWRFMPQDFRMATVYGVPAGSSLADWPISYEDMEPWYSRVEWEMGVAGDPNALTMDPGRKRPYPMPPGPLPRQGKILRSAASQLGWQVTSVPLLINSEPYNGRPACAQCQHCVGFGCPVDAKTGTQNSMVPRALATGNCTLRTQCIAERILTDHTGRAYGISYFDTNGERIETTADVIVCSGGAVESARLLINSRSHSEPNGLGNNTGHVGRHLQGHVYPIVNGLFEEDVYDGIGPGVSTATCRFNHGNGDVIGGGMLADDFIITPINFHKGMIPGDVPRWGLANKHFMRHNYRRTLGIRGPVQEIPYADARVAVDSDVRDRWGIPVARLSGSMHPETLRTSQFMIDRAREWIQAAGAVKVWGGTPGPYLSGGQHQSGTCRMGDDPECSVVDSNQCVHGHDNVYVCDGSVHVTNGGFNPVLTILATAYRAADGIVKRW